MAHILVFKLKENKFYIHQTILPFMDSAQITNAFINKNYEKLDDLLKDTVKKIESKSKWVKQYPILFLWEIRAVADLFLLNQVEDEIKQYYISKFGKNSINNDKFEIDYNIVSDDYISTDVDIITTNKKNIINKIREITNNMSFVIDGIDRKITNDIIDRHYQILCKLESELKEINNKLENLIE